MWIHACVCVFKGSCVCVCVESEAALAGYCTDCKDQVCMWCVCTCV